MLNKYFITCSCGCMFLCDNKDIQLKHYIKCPNCNTLNTISDKNMIYLDHPLYGGITEYGKIIQSKYNIII